jgi:hypothetical protein
MVKTKSTTKTPNHQSYIPPSAKPFDFAQGGGQVGGTKKVKSTTMTLHHQRHRRKKDATKSRQLELSLPSNQVLFIMC